MQRLKESVGKMSEKECSVMTVMSVKLLIMMEKQGNLRSLYIGSDSSTLSTRGTERASGSRTSLGAMNGPRKLPHPLETTTLLV